METLIQDVRYGLRMLRKSPCLTAVAVLTLALGIGANSTIFSWINGTLLNPIPGVSHTSECVELTGLSYPDYVDLRDRNHSFSVINQTFAIAISPILLREFQCEYSVIYMMHGLITWLCLRRTF